LLRSAEASPQGEVALLSFPSEISEARGVAEMIHQLVQINHVPPEEILVLLRGDHNSTFSRPIKQALNARSIAYSDPDAVTRMLGEPENRRLLAIMRLLVDNRDSLAWQRSCI
jgi:superfamily I DNA/RNA helicase